MQPYLCNAMDVLDGGRVLRPDCSLVACAKLVGSQ